MRPTTITCLWYFVLACCWGRCLSVPQQLIDDFKKSLLPLLGIKERPKIEGKIQVPEALRKLYDLQNDFPLETTSIPLPGMHTQHANTIRSFIHIESPVDERFTNHHRFRLKFDVSSIPPEEKIKAAELKLTPDILQSDKDKMHNLRRRVLLHDIIQRGRKGFYRPITRVIDSVEFNGKKNDTLSMDILMAVERWLKNPASNHGVIVEVLTLDFQKIDKSAQRHLRLRRSPADSDDSLWANQRPLMLTFTDDGRTLPRTGENMRNIRRKRTPRRIRKGDRDPCRRHSMYVDFEVVEWNNWIVAPPGYNAFYCAGACEYPLAEHMNTTNHAIVQSMLNSARPLAVPKPCCVPTELSSISMLYVMGGAEHNVVLKNYQDMVVVGCGCR